MKCPNCSNPAMLENLSLIRSISHARELYPWAEVYDMPIMRYEKYCVVCDTHVELPPEILYDND